MDGSWRVVRLRFGWRGLRGEYGPVCPVSLVISRLGKIITCLRCNIIREDKLGGRCWVKVMFYDS